MTTIQERLRARAAQARKNIEELSAPPRMRDALLSKARELDAAADEIDRLHAALKASDTSLLELSHWAQPRHATFIHEAIGAARSRALKPNPEARTMCGDRPINVADGIRELFAPIGGAELNIPARTTKAPATDASGDWVEKVRAKLCDALGYHNSGLNGATGIAIEETISLLPAPESVKQ